MPFFVNYIEYNISIHTPHAGSDGADCKTHQTGRISIHTPHAGSDPFVFDALFPIEISIHTPHAGSDIPETQSLML